MKFKQVRSFLESWGLHFDTPDGTSNDIPYPQVYHRMKADAVSRLDGSILSQFISSITDTVDGRTYLTCNSWNEVEKAWSDFVPEL